MVEDLLLADFHFSVGLRVLEAVMTEEGLDPKAVFAAAKLELDRDPDHVNRFSGPQEWGFQREFRRQTPRRPDIWVKAGLRFRLSAYGYLGLAMMTAPNLRHWFRMPNIGHTTFAIRHLEAIEVDGDLIGMELDLSDVPNDLHDFMIFFSLGASSALFRDLWGGEFPFSLVCLPLDAQYQKIERMIGHRIQHTSTGRLTWYWPAHLSDRPLFHSDDFLNKVLSDKFTSDNNITSKTFVAKVEEMIEVIDSDKNPLRKTASHLGIALRTLQRKLQKDGVTFRALVERVRLRKSMRMLTSTRLPISEIAWQMGFSDPSSFDHAFRRWTGETPKEVRERFLVELSTSADAEEGCESDDPCKPN